MVKALHAPVPVGDIAQRRPRAVPVSAARGVAPQHDLKIGSVDDPLEHKADRVADVVMRMPDRGHSLTTAHSCDCHSTDGPDFRFARIPVSARPSALAQQQVAVSQPEDRDEVEADRVAEAVLGRSRFAAPTSTHEQGPGSVQRKCKECSEEDEALQAQRKPAGGAPTTVSRASVEMSGGTTLPADVREHFEARFGHDFSTVRVHTGARAAEAAGDLSARAFTIGTDVAFAPGEFQPATAHGQRLLAHELVHVIQQTGGEPRAAAAAVNTSSVSRARVQREGTEVPPMGFGLDQRYPRCSDAQSRAVQYEIEMGRLNVAGAVVQLEEELARIESPNPGAGIITMTGSALDRYFKTRKPELVKTIVARLKRIERALDRKPENWTCMTQKQCMGFCSNNGSNALACAGPSSPVGLCDLYFTSTSRHVERSMTLVHEAAHQAGLMGDTYSFSKKFADLSTFQAMINADSYAYFVQETALGGLPTTTEKRISSEWTPDLISAALSVDVPAEGALAEVNGWGETHLTRQQSIIKNRFSGRFWFNTDVGGPTDDPSQGIPRPMIFRAPRIRARITLRRRTSGGNGGAAASRSEVLYSQEVAEATYRGAGAPMGPDFEFDLIFATADRGELIVEAWIIDLDTSTTRKLTESLEVDP